MTKKFIAFAFLGTLVFASCSKKDSTYEKDSNVMLQEPEVSVTDSATITKPTDVTSTEVVVDTTNIEADSAAIK